MDGISRPSMLSLLNQVIDGRYRVVEILGEGGMGAVYRATQVGGDDVAIKVLHDDLGNNAELRERFEREARALFGLEHPHILGVHDFGIINGNPYLAMELLQGQSLDVYIEEHPPNPDTAVAIAKQILTGLAHSHSQGVLHRDLKTENVFVQMGTDGSMTAKLLDFGLVKFVDDDRWGESRKLTMQGSVFGTPAYMAPEQCTGAPSDARTDVYSMGCIIFELMTGLWPFMEESQVMMFKAHLTEPPPSMTSVAEGPVFHPALEALVQKAMAKQPDQRFNDATEMLAALHAVPSPLASPAAAIAQPIAAPQPLAARKQGSGTPALIVLALGVGALLIVVVVVAAFFLLRS